MTPPFAPTRDRRRLEMTTDRVEAVCASYKIIAHVWGGWIRRDRLIMIVATTPSGYDLRKLQNDIALSLGVPTRVFRDAVICEVLS